VRIVSAFVMLAAQDSDSGGGQRHVMSLAHLHARPLHIGDLAGMGEIAN
jgi:hypothetical protein